MNSAQEFKIYSPVQREREKKAGVPVRGTVEPRGATPSQSARPYAIREARLERITCAYVNSFMNARNVAIGRRPQQFTA